MKKILYILYAAASIAVIGEYVFICGIFTGPLVMLLVLGIGIANIILAIKDLDGRSALLFLIATIGLCMGYWKLMF